MKKEKRIIVFIGASGAGKSQLSINLNKIGIPRCISHTDREMRNGEIEGISYYFVSKEDFQKVDFVESSSYAGNNYGLSFKEVTEKLSSYDIVYAVTEINGVHALRKIYGDMVTVIFVSVTPETAVQRMKERGDNIKLIEDRAKNSISTKEFDNYVYADVVLDNNGHLSESIKELFAIIEGIKKDICF